MKRLVFLCLLCLVTVMQIAYAQNRLFAPAVNYPARINPSSVFAADLDGDGFMDLATTNSVSDNVSILRNKGNGTFWGAVSYWVGAGSAPSSVYAADFNGDGHNDLAVADGGLDRVSVLINTGNGTFLSPANYPVGDDPASVFAINLDSDGNIDLAVANRSSENVSILKNNGDGTFQAGVSPVAEGHPIGVISFDSDGDGDNDLAVACADSACDLILVNNGNATFLPAIRLWAGGGVTSISAGDFDNDGDKDLAIPGILGYAYTSIMRNNGNNSFSEYSSFESGIYPKSIVAGDFDDDGKNDLAVVDFNSDVVNIYINNDNCIFQYPPIGFGTGRNPCFVVTADFNNDSDNDLAIANYGSNDVSVLMNINGSLLNSISGTVYHDTDESGHLDIGEEGLFEWMVLLTGTNPSRDPQARSTDKSGYYIFTDLEPGDYEVQAILPEGQGWHPTDPPISHHVSLNAGDIIYDLNFGNNRNANVQDLSVSIGATRARHGRDKTYTIQYKNIGTMAVNNVSVALICPLLTSYVSSAPPGLYDPATPRLVTWNFGSLAAGDVGLLSVNVNVLAPMGDMLESNVSIDPTLGDIDASNNADIEYEIVVNSYDPNEKHVTPEGYVTVADILNYHIDFQNVGNDTAFNIVVVDTLHPNLNLMTLGNMITSHPSTLTIFGRKLIWTFNNINLLDIHADEPGSSGFIEFSVWPLPGLSPGDVMENRASIYFDDNDPVVTNTVINTIGPPPCVYTPGDANGNGAFNGLDVSFSVAYFKGGPPPPYTCDCPPNGTWYVAGDVNASCSFNGLDVSYMVTYFKGGPPSHPCADCPPAGLLAPPAPGVVPTPAVLPIVAPTLKIKPKAGSAE